MKTVDLMILAAVTITVFAICAVGGLDHPHTIAGAIARFVFSVR